MTSQRVGKKSGKQRGGGLPSKRLGLESASETGFRNTERIEKEGGVTKELYEGTPVQQRVLAGYSS